MALAAMLPPLHAHHRVHSCFLPLAIASILFTAFCPWLMLKEPEQCVSVDSPCAVIPPPTIYASFGDPSPALAVLYR